MTTEPEPLAPTPLPWRSHLDTKRWETLPRWAREELAGLMRTVEDLEAVVTGPADSDTWANPYSAKPTPLGRRPRIEHAWLTVNGHRQTTHVVFGEDGLVEVSVSNGSICMHPVVSNVVQVFPGERRDLQ
jgi:hypothetical protein